VAAAVERRTGFPGVVGAIDGCHIEISTPTEEPNRRGAGTEKGNNLFGVHSSTDLYSFFTIQTHSRAFHNISLSTTPHYGAVSLPDDNTGRTRHPPGGQLLQYLHY